LFAGDLLVRRVDRAHQTIPGGDPAQMTRSLAAKGAAASE
jgi:hypothetical protein